ANRGVGELIIDAERSQYVRGLECGRRTGRTGRYGNVAQRHKQRFALDERKADVEVARQAQLRMAVETDSVYLAAQAGVQVLAQLQQSCRFRCHLRGRQLAGLPQTYDSRNVQ